MTLANGPKPSAKSSCLVFKQLPCNKTTSIGPGVEARAQADKPSQESSCMFRRNPEPFNILLQGSKYPDRIYMDPKTPTKELGQSIRDIGSGALMLLPGGGFLKWGTPI